MKHLLIAALQRVIISKLSPLSEKDIEEIKDIFDTLYGWEEFWRYEESSEEVIKKDFIEWANEEAKKFEAFSDPFPIYRAICIPNIDDIDIKNLGAHWSYDKSTKCVASPRFKDSSTFFLQMDIPKNKVLWFESIARQIGEPEENEINPERGQYEVKVFNETWDLIDTIKGYVKPAL